VQESKAESLTEREMRLEAAANLLLEQLVPSVREFAYEVADVVLKVPRWQLLCGTLLAQFEGGTLTAPSLDPTWTEGKKTTGKRICQKCGKEFEPFKAFQRFCGNACGIPALREEKRAASKGTA